MMILAPMQGLTEVLFRKVYSDCFPGDIDYAISPFLSLTHGNLADACKKIGDVLPENNMGCMPVVPQVLGKEPEEFVALANRLGEVVDAATIPSTQDGKLEINWNIGCPMRRVAAKHRGSGILPYPNEIRSVLEYVVPRLQNTSLSIKMRLGYYRDDEIFQIIPILNDYPLHSITIHPRIGKQLYGGQPNLDRLAEVIPLIRHKIIYNGDICTVDDYNKIRHRFPSISDVMIGRGVLYDPSLPSKIKGATAPRSQVFLFVNSLFEAIEQRNIPEVSKMRKTKEYWCLLWKSLGITETQSLQVLHAQTLTETRNKIESLMGNCER